MDEDWERLLDDALDRKRARAKSVRFTEFETAPGEESTELAPDPSPAPREAPVRAAEPETGAPSSQPDIERLENELRELRRIVQDLSEENRKLRARVNGRGASSEEVERLKKDLSEARAIIRSIEEAYRMGRRRPRR